MPFTQVRALGAQVSSYEANAIQLDQQLASCQVGACAPLVMWVRVCGGVWVWVWVWVRGVWRPAAHGRTSTATPAVCSQVRGGYVCFWCRGTYSALARPDCLTLRKCLRAHAPAQVDLKCVQDRVRSKDAQNSELRAQLEQQAARARAREVELARLQAEMAQVRVRMRVLAGHQGGTCCCCCCCCCCLPGAVGESKRGRGAMLHCMTPVHRGSPALWAACRRGAAVRARCGCSLAPHPGRHPPAVAPATLPRTAPSRPSPSFSLQASAAHARGAKHMDRELGRLVLSLRELMLGAGTPAEQLAHTPPQRSRTRARAQPQSHEAANAAGAAAGNAEGAGGPAPSALQQQQQQQEPACGSSAASLSSSCSAAQGVGAASSKPLQQLHALLDVVADALSKRDQQVGVRACVGVHVCTRKTFPDLLQ